MIQGLKRPIQAYTWEIVWILLSIYWSTTNSSEIGRLLWSISGLAGLASLTHMIIKRNYIEVADNKLILNGSLFRKRIIELNQIDKFEYEPGPFTSSKIILKDKTKVKYHDSQTDFKELKEFMGRFNIIVE